MDAYDEFDIPMFDDPADRPLDPPADEEELNWAKAELEILNAIEFERLPELLPSDDSTPWTVCRECGYEFLPTIETISTMCRDCSRRWFRYA